MKTNTSQLLQLSIQCFTRFDEAWFSSIEAFHYKSKEKPWPRKRHLRLKIVDICENFRAISQRSDWVDPANPLRQDLRGMQCWERTPNRYRHEPVVEKEIRKVSSQVSLTEIQVQQYVYWYHQSLYLDYNFPRL